MDNLWYFTFGCGHRLKDFYQPVEGSYDDARNKMFDEYGSKWAFQYSIEEFEEAVSEGYFVKLKALPIIK